MASVNYDIVSTYIPYDAEELACEVLEWLDSADPDEEEIHDALESCVYSEDTEWLLMKTYQSPDTADLDAAKRDFFWDLCDAVKNGAIKPEEDDDDEEE